MSLTSPVGINPDRVADFNLGDHWINRAKTLRVETGGNLRPLDQEVPYSAFDNGATIPYGEGYYPDSLDSGQAAGYVIQSGSVSLEAGSWVIRWDGDSDIHLQGGSFPTTTLSGEGPGNRHVVTLSGSIGNSVVSLQGVDIASLEIMRLADEAAYDAGQRYTTKFLDQMDDFDHIRFMNWQRINDYVGFTDWANRPKIGDLSYAGPGGVPLEVMIDLCNAESKSPWFCIPHTWSFASIRSFADEVAVDLSAGLLCYIELSNELWNSLFAQTTWLYDEGERLGLDPDGNRFRAGRRFLAQRSREVFRIFDEAFIAAGRDLSDLRRVVSWQHAQADGHFPDLLDWRNNSSEIQHYATAPYVGGKMGNNDNATATLALSEAGVVAEMETIWANYWTTGESTDKAESCKLIFDGLAERGVVPASYEAGHHLLDLTSPTESGLQAHLQSSANHADMRGLYENLVDDWFANNGGPATFLGLNWFDDVDGFWGFYTTAMDEDPAHPKLLGLRDGVAKL